MNVLTIYNHGTGGSSTKGYDKLEIVDCFGNLHRNFDAGGLRLRWYITEGVGSKPDPANVGQLVFDENRMVLHTAEPSRGGRLQAHSNMAPGAKRIGTRVITGVKAEEHGRLKDKNTSLRDPGMSKGMFRPRGLKVEQVSDEELLVEVHREPPFEWQQALSSPRMEPHLQRLELYSPGVTGLISRGNRSVARADEGSGRGTLVANDLIA